MATFFLFVFLCLIVAGYAYFSSKILDMQYAIEAGPTEDSDPLTLKRLSHKVPQFRFSYKGRIHSSSEFIRIEIHGSCMEKRGILNGEHWLVEPLYGDDMVREKIMPSDVLLIYLPDKDEYKIREFSGYRNKQKDELTTGSYCNNEWRESSKPHCISLVKGIVRYRI